MRRGAAHLSSARVGLGRLEQGAATRRGALWLFVAALAIYALESIALPVIPGRDFYTYVRFYLQMFDVHSVLPMSMLFRTPLAPLVVVAPLDLLGGWATQVLMALLFGASVVAWHRTALVFGRRAALLVAIALLLCPGYGILFHELSSDAISAVAVAGWALALSRAYLEPTPLRFAVAGLTIAAAGLVRPGNQVLVVLALAPLALAIPWRRRLAGVASCAVAAALVLGAWTVNNGLRYDDYAVARGGNAFLPFFRAFVRDRIVSPDNGPATRELARAVERDLLTQEPYRSYGVTRDLFFRRASEREFEDVLGLSDRVWGWDSDYSIMRRVGIEAVRAHPGAYARGVANTFFQELWHPLFVELAHKQRQQAPVATAPRALQSEGGTIVVNGKRLPRPSGGELIPSAHQGLFSTTPDGHIQEIWTSPTHHEVVFSDPDAGLRNHRVSAEADRLFALIPPYAGSPWLTLQFSRSSKLFPPALLWLVAGIAGLLIRRPRHARLAVMIALGALLITLLNSLAHYAIIEFAAPLIPAFVLLGAAGLVGRRGAESLDR